MGDLEHTSKPTMTHQMLTDVLAEESDAPAAVHVTVEFFGGHYQRYQRTGIFNYSLWFIYWDDRLLSRGRLSWSLRYR
jgi:hypothetical protein